MASQKDRLWRVLKIELPNTDFDSEPVDYFLAALETEDVTEDAMCEAFGPILLSYNVVSDPDDHEVRDVCRKILKRLRSDGFWSAASNASPAAAPVGDRIRQRNADKVDKAVVETDVGGDTEAVSGLDAWLQTLRLTMYREQAYAWCKEMGAIDIEELIENCEDFSKALGLKPLEHKRVMKAKSERNGKGAAQDAATAGDQSGGKGASRAPAQQTAASGYPSSKEADAARRREVQPSPKPEAPKVQSIKDIGEPPNQYHLLEKIGEGVSAVVYRASRLEEGQRREYAVKAVSLSKLQLHGDIKSISSKLKRETSILFTLRHKNIVSLYDVIEEKDKTLYLVMELVGGDLFDYIVKHGCLEESEARFVFLQLVEALKHIHAKGIVHRDLKPENILIHRATKDQGLDVKISDFGHSKLVNDGYSVAVSKVGTPQYWAPEVSEVRLDASSKKKGYDETADLWSLGVVLYVMLEGTYPFDGVEKRMEEQIRNAEVNFKATSRTSVAAREIITGLIKVSPKERITLEQLSKKPWVRDGVVGSVMNIINSGDSSRQQGWEENIRLPRDPPDVKHFKEDLQQFGTKWKHGAALSSRQQVSVTWRTDDKDARDELYRLLAYHFPSHHFPDKRPTGASGRGRDSGVGIGGPLAPVREEANASHATPKSRGDTFRMIGPFKLRVDKDHGAGLELREEEKGMAVKLVDRIPGQPNLRVGDLIVKINNVNLGPATPDQVRETFGKHFRDGVEIMVRRKPSS